MTCAACCAITCAACCAVTYAACCAVTCAALICLKSTHNLLVVFTHWPRTAKSVLRCFLPHVALLPVLFISTSVLNLLVFFISWTLSRMQSQPPGSSYCLLHDSFCWGFSPWLSVCASDCMCWTSLRWQNHLPKTMHRQVRALQIATHITLVFGTGVIAIACCMQNVPQVHCMSKCSC